MQNTPNDYLKSSLAEAMRSIYNQPTYNQQQLAQPQQVQSQLTPEQLAYIKQQYEQAIQPKLSPQAEQLEGEWRGKDVNIEGHPILSEALTPFRNVTGDLAQIGTGLGNLAGRLWNNPGQVWNEAKEGTIDYLTDLYSRVERPETGDKIADFVNQNPLTRGIAYGKEIAKDYWNFLPGSLPILNTKTVGSIVEDIRKGKGESAFRKLKEAGVNSWDKFKYDPLITMLEVAPETTVKGIGKGVKSGLNTAEKLGLPVGEVSKNVAKSIQTIESKFNKDKYDLIKESNSFRKISNNDFVTLLRDYTEGTGLPEHLQPLKKKFADFQNKYIATFDDNALVNPNELAALEYVQRKTGMTMQDIRRELTPQLESLQEGVTNPSLLSKNRLSDFEHTVNRARKDLKSKEFLSDKKLLSELSESELGEVQKHLSLDEIGTLRESGASIKDVKQYLGDFTRDSWTPAKVSKAALEDVKFKENMGRLASLAEETGNPLYKHLYDGVNLANEGRIGSYTMANAKVPRTGIVSNEGRRFQGKSSSREYGTASYEEIAKAYKNMDNFLEDVTLQRVKDEISRNLIETGTIDGARKVGSNVAAKDLRYLNTDLLGEGRLSEAISKASTGATDGSVAISKYELKALEGMLKPTGAPYKTGILGDVYNLFKESALASGIYLGGNFASGAFGTLLNSGANVIGDTISAIGSKGRLAKELGVFRPIRPTERRYSTGVARGISKVGRRLGTGVAPRLDALMQNTFAEINAQAALRKAGIPATQRVSSVSNLNKAKLANIIEDVKLNSMMNNKYRIFGRGEIRDALGIANPFLDWIDTSTQVTAKMLKDHPVLMGAVAAKTLGEIAFDKELQQRLGLNVVTDKPLVTYIPDSKTGGAKEVSINFLPQLTPLEFLVNPTKLVTGTSGAPFLTALYEASRGNNVYGNPMRRTHSNEAFQAVQGNTRYRINPETHMIEPINKTQGDEMLSTTLKNLVGPINLWNKTIAPIGTEIYNKVTGSNERYYMPYGQSVFGSWKTGQPEMGGEWWRPTTFSTGDPRNPREIKNIIEGLGTYYERPYYNPGQLTGNQIRRIIRSGVRQNLRDQGDY